MERSRDDFDLDDAEEIMRIVLRRFSFMPCCVDEMLGEDTLEKIKEEILDYIS